MPTANGLPNNLNSMTCAQLKDLLKLRDLGRFIEEQLHGSGGSNNANNASSVVNPEGKKKMEGFGSTPPVTDQQQQEEVRLSGILWKRRSGLGKHSTIKASEKRQVELRGNKLVYYSAPNIVSELSELVATVDDTMGQMAVTWSDVAICS